MLGHSTVRLIGVPYDPQININYHSIVILLLFQILSDSKQLILCSKDLSFVLSKCALFNSAKYPIVNCGQCAILSGRYDRLARLHFVKNKTRTSWAHLVLNEYFPTNHQSQRIRLLLSVDSVYSIDFFQKDFLSYDIRFDQQVKRSSESLHQKKRKSNQIKKQLSMVITDQISEKILERDFDFVRKKTAFNCW